MASTGQEQPRRLGANEVFADMQFYDPQGLVVGMLIRATSTAAWAEAVAGSSAVARLYDVSGNPVLNCTVSATAKVVPPMPAVDVGVDRGTVTVKYEWPRLTAPRSGTYYYEVVITAITGGCSTSLGVYQSSWFDC